MRVSNSFSLRLYIYPSVPDFVSITINAHHDLTLSYFSSLIVSSMFIGPGPLVRLALGS